MTLVSTPDLLRAAERCIWFEAPDEALRQPARLAAYILTLGTIEDVRALRAQVDNGELKTLLDEAPAGIFDARSWAYWNLVIGRADAPMPRRLLPGIVDA